MDHTQRVERTGMVVAVVRLRNSLSGNPRWRVTWMTDGNARAEWAVTAPDTPVGNIVDPALRGQLCRIVTTVKGIVDIGSLERVA
jgi:hypothetical protein